MRSFSTNKDELNSGVSQKSECRLWRWYVEALRCALWPDEEDWAPEEEEEVECLLVPLAMVPDRIRARLKLLLDRDSVPSACETDTKLQRDRTSIFISAQQHRPRESSSYASVN